LHSPIALAYAFSIAPFGSHDLLSLLTAGRHAVRFFCACLAVRLLTVGGTRAGQSLGIASLAKRNGEGTTVEVDTL